MDTFATIVLYLLAAIGALTIVSSVGVFVMTWRLTDPAPDVAEIVAAHTGNVRVLPQPSDPVPVTHYLVGDSVIDLAPSKVSDRSQHDLGPACALCGGDHSPATTQWDANAPVTITHYAVGSDEAPGELRCWVCHKPCPSGVCNCTTASAS